ncbi:MAG: helix-turn-helix domain-containing protein [Planctomycetes bacterium]|nr:helix-turn-helix domain-containing protein [Planctomycetota bacterium]
MEIVENDRLLNMTETSNLLGIKKSTLYLMVMRKKITHIKLGKLTKFRQQDLQAHIKNNLIEGQV